MSRKLWLPAAFLVGLTGCVSLNVNGAPIGAILPSITAQFAGALPSPLPSGAPHALPTYGPAVGPPAGSCANGAQPASGTMAGTAAMGDYQDKVLPGSFGTYQSEQDVTDRITRFARDGSSQGQSTWADFQCLFPDAVAVWATKGQEGAALPPPPVAMGAAPSPDAAASARPGCAAGLDPANGTMAGTDAMGDYAGETLPGSFSSYDSEQAVTDRIGAFAGDTSAQGLAVWTTFQCFYPQAVATWRSKQGGG